MSKYSLRYLMENDMDDLTPSTRLRITNNVVATPTGNSTIEDLVAALNDPANYGMYLSNLLNVNKFIKDQLAAYYGTPNQRIRGNYPMKSAANTSAFILNLLNTNPDQTRIIPVQVSKNTDWKQVGNEIHAAPSKQRTKDQQITKKHITDVFTTVFNNAGVTYNITA